MTQSATIYVGLDGSAGSEHALAWAENFARDRNLVIRPIKAWHEPTEPFSTFPIRSSPTTATQLQSDAQNAANQWFAEWSAAHGTNDVVLQPEAVHGPPADVLVDRSKGSALLVVGSRGRGTLAGLAMGSVSSKCAAKAQGPIAVIPEPARIEGVHRVVVGHDGSSFADAALQWAVTSLPEATIDVLNAWSVPVPTGTYGSAIGRVEFESYANEIVVTAIANVRANGAGADQQIEPVIDFGDARRVLNRRATEDGADLLVLGAQANHGFGRLLMGSVAQNVLHHLAVPTVIVPST